MHVATRNLTALILMMTPVPLTAETGQIAAEEQCREAIASRSETVVAETLTIVGDSIELNWGGGAMAITPLPDSAVPTLVAESVAGRRVLGASIDGYLFLVLAHPSATDGAVTCSLVPLE